MLLVFLVIILILLIISLRIEFEIENLKYSDKHISNNIKVKFRFYILEKIKILDIKFNKEKLNKIISKQKFSKIDTKKLKENLPKSNKDKLKILKIFRVKKLNLYLSIGTEDIMFTTFIIPTISTILSFILAKIGNNNCKYKIEPIYNDKNTVKISLDSIISIKIVHIIGIMWKILKNGDGKNEITSNRRTYAYSNE